MPAAMYAPHIPPTRHNGVAMGMVAGTTMAMSAGEHRWLHSFLIKCFKAGCLDLVLRLTRNLADNPFTSICHPPPSDYAHISAPRHAQLQLCAPAVVKGGECKYKVMGSVPSHIVAETAVALAFKI